MLNYIKRKYDLTYVICSYGLFVIANQMYFKVHHDYYAFSMIAIIVFWMTVLKIAEISRDNNA